MSHKPILTPIVEIKIPQDVNYSGHVRKQTPEKLEAERKREFTERHTAQEQKWGAILLARLRFGSTIL